MPNNLEAVKQVVEERNRRPGKQFGNDDLLRPFLSRVSRYWWVELLAGVLWLVVAVVVLKFNRASVVTVGVLTGLMFLLFAVGELSLAALDRGARWLWAIFGVLLTAAGIVALIQPVKTFAGLADIPSGFVFLLIGVLLRAGLDNSAPHSHSSCAIPCFRRMPRCAALERRSSPRTQLACG